MRRVAHPMFVLSGTYLGQEPSDTRLDTRFHLILWHELLEELGELAFDGDILFPDLDPALDRRREEAHLASKGIVHGVAFPPSLLVHDLDWRARRAFEKLGGGIVDELSGALKAFVVSDGYTHCFRETRIGGPCVTVLASRQAKCPVAQ